MRVSTLLAALAVSFAVLEATHAVWAGEERINVAMSRCGRMSLSRSRHSIAVIEPGLFETPWRGASLAGSAVAEPRGNIRFGRIISPGGTEVECETKTDFNGDRLSASYRLVPKADIYLNSFHVAVVFPAGVLRGGKYVADGEDGRFPMDFGNIVLRSGQTRNLSITTAEGVTLAFKFARPVHLLLQDDRKWGPSFTVRIGAQTDGKTPWPKGKALEVEFELLSSEGMTVEYDEQVAITAGAEWIPLKLELDVESGSALDFSGISGVRAPAGAY